MSINSRNQSEKDYKKLTWPPRVRVRIRSINQNKKQGIKKLKQRRLEKKRRKRLTKIDKSDEKVVLQS